MRIALMSVAGLLVSAGCWVGPPEETTDVNRYHALRRSWSDLADHFPGEIPASARSVSCSHFPGFLQGGAWLQLRVELPDREVEAIEARIAPRAIRRYEGGGDVTRHLNQLDGLPTTTYRTGAEGSGEFPESFTLYVLRAEDRGSPGHAWNHGLSAGLSISKERGEVVYWADRW
ncbi:hypothetical protein [Tautonia rosea]|uniref:hypothetical protein n=1 Tax=Tautonia rosea TaxID=2728037 RepID=UPI0014765E53|nr:hypothetical protein [Tautonia rosea]